MERQMNTWIKRGVLLALAAALIPSGAAPASADGRGAAFGAGVAAGIIGLGVLGAAEAQRERDYYYSHYGPYCHPGPLECHTYEPRCFHDDYGAFICPPPERRCFRHPVCD
jgi:hypothetical protein